MQVGRLAAACLPSARAASSQRAVAAARIAPQVFAGFAAARVGRVTSRTLSALAKLAELTVRTSKLAELTFPDFATNVYEVYNNYMFQILQHHKSKSKYVLQLYFSIR